MNLSSLIKQYFPAADYRTDVADEFDTLFLNDKELEQLW